MSLPIWLQIILGVFRIVLPQYAWLQLVITAAYEIWLEIPWFHKAGALYELRLAVKRALETKSTVPVENFNAAWKA